MTRINGLNDVLRVRSIIWSDYGRCFWGLFGENGWRKSECMKISAFCYVFQDPKNYKSGQGRAD